MIELSNQPTLASTGTHEEERLLTISDVAEWLGVSKSWVYDHTTRKRPRVPSVRIGEMTRFRRADIKKFIEEHASD
jgi:excisionase family DNA binding protein